ncbi:Matrix metalloproteinase-17 [Sciurus carolinensis]|uniref:Matrix metalloproteinase-17 n=1 Tax=Sciurus carolinensis TaxID=30640 RepID=A0AA41SRP0_SCICA|nr:Matrix metalloproteinase-17 [Sciurus carolinensis]
MGRRAARGPGPPLPGLRLLPLLLLLALAARGGCAAPAPAPRAEDLSLGVPLQGSRPQLFCSLDVPAGPTQAFHLLVPLPEHSSGLKCHPGLSLELLLSCPITSLLPSAQQLPYRPCLEWLSKFGYLPPADPTTGRLQTQEELSKAITAMQQFGGLEATGILDAATLALMKTPRCSLPDLPPLTWARRRRQTPAPTKWNKRNLSWRVRTFPRAAALGPDTVRALMHYALKVWSDISPLNFHEVAGSAADIQIDFARADHQDAYPFDGPGGTVAHAFFPGDHPSAGDTHFDEEEAWTFRSSDAHGMDLFAVAVHEFGHAIGLSHVSASSSIMRPYYQGPVGDPLRYHLPYQDRVRVWQLYGVRESVSPTAPLDTPEPEQPPLLPEPPDNRSSSPLRKDVPHRCSAHFDAVAQIRGEAFFFKGKYFWRLNRDRHLVSLQPAQMHRFWRGLPLHLDSVDAVYERTSDHKIVFFKELTWAPALACPGDRSGDRYWVFKDNNVEEGYPRPISDFSLPPGGVDAAFSWSHNDRTYFFKDQLYWRYDDHTRRMDPGYPAQGPLWRGVPSTLDDAMRWSDGAAYFFRGQEYWKVQDGELEAAPGYPQSTARDWLVCGEPPKAGEVEAARAQPGPQGRSQDGFAVCSCSAAAPAPPRAPSAPLLLLCALGAATRARAP